MQRPWLLAGGLTENNVGRAIDELSPPAVDVSGGVESAPGEKDPLRMRRFIAAVRNADQRRSEDAVL
jgi:phosphoribosylanthranilate isomerase